MYCSISKSLFIIKTSLFKIYKGAYLTVYPGSFGSLYSFSHMECFWDCVWMCLPGICPAFITFYNLRIWDYFCIYILQSFCCSFCCCVIAGDDCYHFQILRTDIPRVPEFNSRNWAYITTIQSLFQGFFAQENNTIKQYITWLFLLELQKNPFIQWKKSQPISSQDNLSTPLAIK